MYGFDKLSKLGKVRGNEFRKPWYSQDIANLNIKTISLICGKTSLTQKIIKDIALNLH